VIELVYEPVPVPFVVLPLGGTIVGSTDVDQHTPRAVTDAPPFADTVPPLDALVSVIAVIAVVVVTTGGPTGVVKLTWAPYDVPTLFVA
jgi:hypothetical protein